MLLGSVIPRGTQARRRLSVVRAGAAGILLAVAASVALPAPPVASDSARESRLADEIVPQLVVGDAVWLSTPGRPRVLALYAAPVGPALGAVVIVHGLGLNPDWGLIGALRSDLASRGFATLSVQMPVLPADAPRDAYRALFPEAGERLAAAVLWLRAKHYTHIALVSHSLGAAMANAYLARSRTRFDAWVTIGFAEDFAAPPNMPVLDIIGENDFPEVIARSRTRRPALPKDRCSQTITMGAADHYFERETKALEAAMAPFIERAFAGRC